MAVFRRSGRELLTGLGIGNFNATMIIQYLWTAPATTDPKSPSIILLVQALQRTLKRAGARLAVTGYLDQPTAAVLTQVVGPGWEQVAWATVVESVLDVLEGKRAMAPGLESGGDTFVAQAQPLDGLLDPAFLPPVPGGIFTYLAGAYVAYRLLKKRG